jgi:hypothetical protein
MEDSRCEASPQPLFCGLMMRGSEKHFGLLYIFYTFYIKRNKFMFSSEAASLFGMQMDLNVSRISNYYM